MAGFKDFYQFAAPDPGRRRRGTDRRASASSSRRRARSAPLIVTDEVIRGTGLIEKVEAGRQDGGLEVARRLRRRRRRTPTPRSSSAAPTAAKEAGADSFLAVGGGSVMDTAKAANVALHPRRRRCSTRRASTTLPREDDGARARRCRWRRSPAIPTTAGTGSEVELRRRDQGPAERIKVVIGDFPLFPDLAILDPEATATLPAPIAAATGMDAMTHAIEGYVSTEWNPHGDAFALQALRLIRDNLARAVERHLRRRGARQHARRRQPGDRPAGLRRDRRSRTRCRTRAAATTASPTASPTRSTCPT